MNKDELKPEDAQPLDPFGKGRDEKGRFLPGCKGGPGNPHAAAVNAWRSALAEAITPDDIAKVTQTLLAKAKGGEAWAVRELLDRCLGKPRQEIAQQIAASIRQETGGYDGDARQFFDKILEQADQDPQADSSSADGDS